MNRVTQTTTATPEQVWNVLSDGWLYPVWVVGATRIREVEDEWPAAGSKLHHSVGVWPLVIDDDTEVAEVVPGRLLKLRARAWPSGEAEVTVKIEEHEDGSEITMEEDLVAGPARFVPAPIRAAALQLRNRECLERLTTLAERHG